MKTNEKQVKERPIIFSADMVQAILDGKKTMTRRVVKHGDHLVEDLAKLHIQFNVVGWIILNEPNGWHIGYPKCPYGKVGDRLWVRETWIQGYDDPLIESEGDDENAVSIIYKADSKELYRPCSAEVAEKWGYWGTDSDTVTWKSPIHMPRFASRILLEITDIRVERLQDISEADAVKEGICSYIFDIEDHPPNAIGYTHIQHDDGKSPLYKTAVLAFKSLWGNINAKKGYAWDSNPWVWCIEFKVIEGA